MTTRIRILTDFVQRSTSFRGLGLSACEDPVDTNAKVYKTPRMAHLMRGMYPVHILKSCLFIILFYYPTIDAKVKCSLQIFRLKFCVHFPIFLCVLYAQHFSPSLDSCCLAKSANLLSSSSRSSSDPRVGCCLSGRNFLQHRVVK